MILVFLFFSLPVLGSGLPAATPPRLVCAEAMMIKSRVKSQESRRRPRGMLTNHTSWRILSTWKQGRYRAGLRNRACLACLAHSAQTRGTWALSDPTHVMHLPAYLHAGNANFITSSPRLIRANNTNFVIMSPQGCMIGNACLPPPALSACTPAPSMYTCLSPSTGIPRSLIA